MSPFWFFLLLAACPIWVPCACVLVGMAVWLGASTYAAILNLMRLGFASVPMGTRQ